MIWRRVWRGVFASRVLRRAEEARRGHPLGSEPVDRVARRVDLRLFRRDQLLIAVVLRFAVGCPAGIGQNVGPQTVEHCFGMADFLSDRLDLACPYQIERFDRCEVILDDDGAGLAACRLNPRVAGFDTVEFDREAVDVEKGQGDVGFQRSLDRLGLARRAVAEIEVGKFVAGALGEEFPGAGGNAADNRILAEVGRAMPENLRPLVRGHFVR
ncbi:MAG: hypothetical protein H7Y08_08640 [Rhizobiaceae bacterium]|nr:hypothetical protein [Rhizobiaceae bacterium]